MIDVTFSGTPTCSSQGRVECNRSSTFTFVSSISQAVRWYLASWNSTDPFTGKVVLRIPAGHRAAVVQGSVPTITTAADGTETWAFAIPVPTDALGFTSGDSSMVSSPDGRFVGFYRSAATKSHMETVLVDAARYYPAMEQMYGKLPGDRFHYTFVPVNFVAGAIGQLNLIFLNEFMTTPQYSYILPQVPHEMAHSWWGNLSSPSTPFLSESMAEYTLWRAKTEVDGEAAGMRGRRMNATWYMYGRPANQDVALIAPNVTSSPVYVHAVYHKGPLVIRALEELVGKDKLTVGLREALKVQPMLTPADWLTAIQTASGVDLTRFRERWLEATGFPKLAVTTKVVGEGTGFKLTLDLAMTGDFPLSVPVVVRLEDGTEQRTNVSLALATASWSKTFASRPVRVEVDREWTSVRELEPKTKGDLTFDGEVDGADILEAALYMGAALPSERRVDGSYDPLFDLNRDFAVNVQDVDAVVAEANK